MIPRRFRPILAFAAVIAAAGSVAAAGLTFTAHTMPQKVAELPQVKQRVLPSYVVRLPEAKPTDLEISKSVAVKPKLQLPVTMPDVPVALARDTPSETSDAAPTLVAEVTALSSDTVEQPLSRGTPYIVRSDVFVRSGPAKSYRQVGTIEGGARVAVTDADGGWLEINFSGGSGWVYQRYLTPTGGEEVAEAETGRAPF